MTNLLKRCYTASEKTVSFNNVIEIANSLPNWASDEQLKETLDKIPYSDEYFVMVSSGEWGYEICILTL